MYARVYVRTYVCMCLCMYVRVHTFMYLCMHVWLGQDREVVAKYGLGVTNNRTKSPETQELTVIQQWKDWLSTIPDGKLPTNQKIEG